MFNSIYTFNYIINKLIQFLLRLSVFLIGVIRLLNLFNFKIKGYCQVGGSKFLFIDNYLFIKISDRNNINFSRI